MRCAHACCAVHITNALSELDAEVVRFARVMQDLDGDANQSGRVVVNGFLLERWCLKYLLGVHAAGSSNLRFASAPETLVRETFGLDRIPGKRGIYLLGPWTGLTGLQLGIQESLVGDETGPKALAGAAINICGALFYLSLTRDRIPQPILDNPHLGEYDISSSQFVFHPLGISLSSDSGAEIHVSFDWTRARS